MGRDSSKQASPHRPVACPPHAVRGGTVIRVVKIWARERRGPRHRNVAGPGTGPAKEKVRGGAIRLAPELYRSASSRASAADGTATALTSVGITASDRSLMGTLRGVAAPMGACIFFSHSIRSPPDAVKRFPAIRLPRISRVGCEHRRLLDTSVEHSCAAGIGSPGAPSHRLRRGQRTGHPDSRHVHATAIRRSAFKPGMVAT